MLLGKNLGSKCHSQIQQWERRDTALTEPSRCRALGAGFCLVPYALSFASSKDFTGRRGGGGTEDTNRSASLRCVGGKLRND